VPALHKFPLTPPSPPNPGERERVRGLSADDICATFRSIYRPICGDSKDRIVGMKKTDRKDGKDVVTDE
jgi:hypothetical protein